MKNNPGSVEDSKRILVVDDLENNRTLLQDFLTTLGYESIMAENGMKALRQIDEVQPDMVLLDIMMPEMNGLEVLEHLRTSGKLVNLPVIVISALEERDSVIECIRLGAQDFLTKPFDPVLLKARVEASLEKKEYRDRERKLKEDLKASFVALKEAEAHRDALSHMIVHDLSNPLAGINGFAYIMFLKLQNDSMGKEDLLKGLKSIQTTSEDMGRMIRGILDVSKLEAGELFVFKEKLNVAPLVRDVADSYRFRAEKEELKITCSVEDEEIAVYADRELLIRILQNLVANAIKFAGKGSEVHILAKRGDNKVIFTVSDDGMVIEDEYKDRIFGKFFQIETESGVMRKSGVGLGLAFCKMAVEAQGGTIWVESPSKVFEKDSPGVDFIVQLPSSG